MVCQPIGMSEKKPGVAALRSDLHPRWKLVWSEILWSSLSA